MALDKTLEFSDKQAMTATANSTVIHELTNTSKNAWGTTINNQIGGASFNVSISTTLTSTGTAAITLVTKADATISSSGTTVATINVPAASVAGTKFSVILPAGTERLAHLGAIITESGTIAAGNCNIWLGFKNEVID